MASLPKLKIHNFVLADTEQPVISPVTPATGDDKTEPVKDEPEKKRRRIGGLPVSALVNEKDDETPVPYPYSADYLPPLAVEPITPARPKFPSILYQMSEFVTQLEDRSVKGSLPSLKSLGLPTSEELAAGIAANKSSNDNVPCREQSVEPRVDKKDKEAENEEILPHQNRKGCNALDQRPSDEPITPSRKRARGEHDKPITTQPEIESLIKTLREREESRRKQPGKNDSSGSSHDQQDGEAHSHIESPPPPRLNHETPSLGVSQNSGVTKHRTHRRGRPNGDERPRPHACPTCQRRFHQQSGVVSHYRVVHLKEKRFECPHRCGLRFGARGDVTRHVDAVHNKIRNFECQVCGDAFARKSILTRHCKNMHQDIFGTKEAHDCVHGCVYKPINNPEKEEKGDGAQR